MKFFGLQVPFIKRATSPVADNRYSTPSVFWGLADSEAITPETAIAFSAVYECVKIISESPVGCWCQAPWLL